MRNKSVFVIASLFIVHSACVDGGNGSGGSQPNDAVGSTDTGPTGDTAVAETGSVTGIVVDESGAGVEGVMILACDDDSCITSKTNGDGGYTIALPFGWRKMQMMGGAKGYTSINYYQNVEGTEPTVASRDIVAVAASADAPSPLPAAEGGTVSLVGGALTITAGPGVASYPIGQTEEITAVSLSASHLPPYDVDAPWAGAEDSTLAFHINPLPVKAASEGQTFQFSATGGTGDYRIFYVDDHYGTLHEGETVAATAEGNIVGTVPVLTTLILVPAG